MSERCCGEVWAQGAWHGKQCSRAGKLEHEGKLYCAIHHPPTVDAKNKSKYERWDRERARDQDKYKREQFAHKLLGRFTTEELENAVAV